MKNCDKLENKKIHNRLLGKWGEDEAVCYLLEKDYHIKEVNWRCGHLEVDIIAEYQGLLVFVEVKTRKNSLYGNPEDAITQKKKNNLISAANYYVKKNKLDVSVRFDVISIILNDNPKEYKIEHFPEAFDKYDYKYIYSH